MSSRGEEKLPTATNSNDDNKNCTKSEDHMKLDGNRDKTLNFKGNKLKKSLTTVNNPPCNPNVDDEKNCKNVMQTKTPKTLEEFENDQDSNFKQYECYQCNGKCGKQKNHQMSLISNTNYSSFQTNTGYNGDEVTEPTTIVNELDNAVESDSESYLSSSTIDNYPQTNQNSYAIEYTGTPSTQIQDGRLFYNNEWYRRGQHIYLEGEFLVKFPATICGIDSNYIWLLKHSDNSKFRFHIDHLAFGEMSIVRYIPVDIIQSIMERYKPL